MIRNRKRCPECDMDWNPYCAECVRRDRSESERARIQREIEDDRRIEEEGQVMDDEATMAMYEELADADGECWRCDGTGFAEYEPIPGTHHEMGVSVRERCHVCNRRGTVDVFVGGRDVTSKAESRGF